MANRPAPSAALLAALTDAREDVASLEAGIEELESSIPEASSTEFWLASKDAITGTRVQIRMDIEYLALKRRDLRRLERQAA